MKLLLIPFLSLLLAWYNQCSPSGSLHCNHDAVDVVILGDSNCWIGGDECDSERGWTAWFKRSFNPASCRSYARSGATWTNTPRTVRDEDNYTELLGDQNVVYNQVCRLLSACDAGLQSTPDLIVIAAGTNDAWFTKRRPRVFDGNVDSVLAAKEALTSQKPSEILSLAQAVCYNCILLHKVFPDARIVLLSPMQCTVTSSESIGRVGDIIELCANRLDIDVVRQDKIGCISRKDELQQLRFTSDGVHTNKLGAQCMGNLLADTLSILLDK